MVTMPVLLPRTPARPRHHRPEDEAKCYEWALLQCDRLIRTEFSSDPEDEHLTLRLG